MLFLTLLLINACLAGCSNHDSTCAWVKPIWLQRQDLVCMAPSTKREILTHNETWEKTR